MICPHLWSFCTPHFGADPFYANPFEQLRCRLALVEPDYFKLQRLACAYTVYHFCKFDQRVQSLIAEHFLDDTFEPWEEIHSRARGFSVTAAHMVT